MSDPKEKRPDGFPVGRPFEPGTSGNPGGRPKGLERTAREALALREYKAKDGKVYTGPEAPIQCLIDLAYDEKVTPRERIAAIREALDRGYGKAKQSVEVFDGGTKQPGRDPKDMTDEEIAESLEAIRTLRRLGMVVTTDDVSEH